MQEIGSYINQAVGNQLNGMCVLFRVDVGGVGLNGFSRKGKELGRWIIAMVNAMGDRLNESNIRNSNQEELLVQINEKLWG